MECNCGAYVPAGMRNCPMCGRLINSDGINPSSMGSRVFEPRKLHLSRTAPEPVGMSSGGGGSGGPEYFRKQDEYVQKQPASSKKGKAKKTGKFQPKIVVPSPPKPPPELTIRHNLVISAASARSPRDIAVNSIIRSRVLLHELSSESHVATTSSKERRFQLRLIADVKGMNPGIPLAETGAFTLAHPSISTKRARRWLDIIQKQALRWGLESVEQRDNTHWYALAFRVRKDIAAIASRP